MDIENVRQIIREEVEGVFEAKGQQDEYATRIKFLQNMYQISSDEAEVAKQIIYRIRELTFGATHDNCKSILDQILEKTYDLERSK